MSYDFAKYAEAIAAPARKGAGVEVMWPKHLKEELTQKRLTEQAADESLSKAS